RTDLYIAVHQVGLGLLLIVSVPGLGLLCQTSTRRAACATPAPVCDPTGTPLTREYSRSGGPTSRRRAARAAAGRSAERVCRVPGRVVVDAEVQRELAAVAGLLDDPDQVPPEVGVVAAAVTVHPGHQPPLGQGQVGAVPLREAHPELQPVVAAVHLAPHRAGT